MLSIGAFAQIGQVSHRMLRHWDAAGLLVPAHVDAFSGYRSYDPEQLERLHRIVALRQLGFGLADISLILDQGVDAGRIASLLRIRQAEVAAEHKLATARLADVQRRLALITKESHMSRIEIIEKPLPATRIAAAIATVSEQPDIATVIQGMFDSVETVLTGHGLGMPIAEYRSVEEGIQVVAGFEYDGADDEGFEIVHLPAVPAAVCGVHLGPMENIHESWQAVHQEILGRGGVPRGACREVYVRSGGEDQEKWVTELQQPVAAATAGR
ncbi:MerR family transcriptional regulator [Glutamicibacter sp. MNS18]|uniref:MerR family transcriptional regulator n=1 Tax=Glutamicibacter sp. MNS18 TaxID=2989817 RepID=UPI0022361E7B|nr:MerR family transcriptional regulator [Glutamicibacter sp. MNS18]MCW4465869.1 MerR family transcriptional regulator [Glutamicibacter sp. MNS18]